MPVDPIALTADLIRCPSVTPVEGGALQLLDQLLSSAGFETWRLIAQTRQTYTRGGAHVELKNLLVLTGTQMLCLLAMRPHGRLTRLAAKFVVASFMVVVQQI